ncbi:trigger factor [Desulfuromonas carbonis]|uniref:trigger factor n=1 Tax=Desulfuromonas sp. DDH964 TaxID=1823759 RepID=UPI00078E885D|nr:trigger factor [Desulfuromonas sp. DDH964]AMV72790.1 trigger factor [Desulfuromonas sp. DDH964]
MNVKIEEISSVRKKLSFELPADHVAAEIDKAYSKIGKSAKLPGFRPGKVPRAILERQFAPQMEEQVLSRLINDSYFKALFEHKILAIADPEIVDSGVIAKGQPFTYEAHVEVKPEFTAKDYTGLKLEKERFEADPEVTDKRIEEMRASRAEMVVSTRKKARKGDFVVIDFEGFLKGEAFEGGKAEGHQLELGSGSFIPGFEEQLEGMKREEEKEIQVTFPADYGNEELAGQEVTFKVRLHEIKEKELPALDDEFAKGFGLDSVAELRARLEENYLTQERNRIDGDLRERLMEALIAANPVEAPETMVSGQLDYMLANIRSRMQSQGMSLEMLGMNEESFRAMYRDTAVKQVQGTLILEAIGRQEGLQVEESEIDGKLEQIAAMSNAPIDAVKRHYGNEDARRGLLLQMGEEKVIEFLLAGAQISEVAKADLAAKSTDDKE